MQKHQQKCVIQVLPALNSGGVERGTLEISEYLVKKGWRSVVISSGLALKIFLNFTEWRLYKLQRLFKRF